MHSRNLFKLAMKLILSENYTRLVEAGFDTGHWQTKSFRDSLSALPLPVKELASQKYQALLANPQLVGIKPIPENKGKLEVWSAQVGHHYRALAAKFQSQYIWYWIGTHEGYNKIKSMPPNSQVMNVINSIIRMRKAANNETLEKTADRFTLAPGRGPEERPTLQRNDVVRLFHGFRDQEDAIAACRYGISGKSRVGRVYSYEADNNPLGLFVTTDPKKASEFGAWIIEFHANMNELEAPVWPSGSYTVQGQMAQYFGQSKAKREQARMDARQKAVERNIPPIAESERPELANTLLGFGESQALFIGHLNPNRIIRVWLRNNQNGQITKVSREEFLKNNKSHSFHPSKSNREAYLASSRVFRVDEEFNPDKFIQSLSDRYSGRWTFDETKRVLVRGLGSKSVHHMKEELLRYVWPKQLPAALRWLSREYRQNLQE
jgi:hypothetical protein